MIGFVLTLALYFSPDTILEFNIRSPIMVKENQRLVVVPITIYLNDTVISYHALWNYETIPCIDLFPCSDQFSFYTICIDSCDYFCYGLITAPYNFPTYDFKPPLLPGKYRAYLLYIYPYGLAPGTYYINFQEGAAFKTMNPDSPFPVKADTILLVVQPAEVEELNSAYHQILWQENEDYLIALTPALIKIYRETGEIILEKKLAAGGILNWKNLPGGIYFFLFYSSQNVALKKIFHIKK
jgi:hypothetical protein